MMPPRSRTGDRPSDYYRHQLNPTRAAELLGMARGVIADGDVNEREMQALLVWIGDNPSVVEQFPGRELAERLMAIYQDGAVTAEERASLAGYLAALTSGAPTSTDGVTPAPAALFDAPPPTVDFEGMIFVFTGDFAFGERTECERLVQSLGGEAKGTVTLSTRYVVVGELGSEAWITSAYGRKIERAIELRASGTSIAVVTEAHWLEQARASPGVG